MYLLHVSDCLMRWHQLVRTLISIGAQIRLICHASLFQLWSVGESDGFKFNNKLFWAAFFSQFVHFLLFPFFCSQII